MRTERLGIEPLVPAHAAETFGPLGDESLYRFIPQDPPQALDALIARYGRLASRRSPDGTEAWLNRVMRDRVSTEIVGTLEATVTPDHVAAIAYVVVVPHQRRGYAAEGVAGMIDHLVSALRVTRLRADVDTRNAASIALQRRLRFTRIAFTRDADHFKSATSDEYRYERVLLPN